MGFVSVDLEGVKEPEVVPDGKYKLRIVKVEDTTSKKGNEMTVFYIRIEDDQYPEAQIIRHWMIYPNEDMEKDQRTMRLRDIKRFLKCFGVEGDKGFDTEDLMGQEGECYVYQEEGENDGNIYNRLQLPRLDQNERRRVA